MTTVRTLAVFIRIEILRFLREPIALFFTLVFPIVLIFIFGGSFGAHTDDSGISYYNSLVAVDAAFLIGNFTLMGVTNDLANQRETGVAESAVLLPINAWQRTVVESAAYLLIVFLSTALVTGYVFAVYPDVEFRGDVGLFVLTLGVAYFAFVSIAKFIVSLRFSARTLQLIGSTIFFLLLFTSGVVIPVQSLPSAVAWFTELSPMYLTYSSLEMIWNDTLEPQALVRALLELIAIIVLLGLAARWRNRVAR